MHLTNMLMSSVHTNPQETSYSTAVSAAGFDNTGLAIMTNWQVFTLSGWYFIMFRTIDNTSPFAGIYFLLLLVLGAYCVVSGVGIGAILQVASPL